MSRFTQLRKLGLAGSLWGTCALILPAAQAVGGPPLPVQLAGAEPAGVDAARIDGLASPVERSIAAIEAPSAPGRLGLLGMDGYRAAPTEVRPVSWTLPGADGAYRVTLGSLGATAGLWGRSFQYTGVRWGDPIPRAATVSGPGSKSAPGLGGTAVASLAAPPMDAVGMPTLLRNGQGLGSAAIGLPRVGLLAAGDRSPDEPFSMAQYRLGLAPGITAESRVEAGSGFLATGAGLAVDVAGLFVAHGALAGSLRGGSGGMANVIGLGQRGEHWAVALQHRSDSCQFAQIGELEPPGFNRNTLRFAASLNLGATEFGLAALVRNTFAGSERRAQASLDHPLGGGARLGAWIVDQGGANAMSGTAVGLTLRLPLDWRVSTLTDG